MQPGAEVTAVLDANGTQSAIQELFLSLHHQCAPPDESAVTPADRALDLLHNCTTLLHAQDALLLQSQNKAFNVIFQGHITTMVGVLNIFLDPDL